MTLLYTNNPSVPKVTNMSSHFFYKQYISPSEFLKKNRILNTNLISYTKHNLIILYLCIRQYFCMKIYDESKILYGWKSLVVVWNFSCISMHMCSIFFLRKYVSRSKTQKSRIATCHPMSEVEMPLCDRGEAYEI